MPLAYLLTFSAYGARLHGDTRGSVDRQHNEFGTPVLPARPGWERAARARMTTAPCLLDECERQLVLEALLSVCSERRWLLLAAHVRSNHIHVVISTGLEPMHLVGAMKARASATLNASESRHRPRWTRGASRRYLWSEADVDAAIEYVVHRQGAPMALYVRRAR